MTNPLPFLVSGVVAGSVYGLAAMGLTLSYRLSRVLNFSHGAIAMFCAFSYWQLHVAWGWPMGVALPLAVIALPVTLAVVTEALVFKLLRDASVFATTAATVGMLLVFYGFGLYFWQSKGVRVPSLFPNRLVALPGVNVSTNQIGIVATVLVIALLLAAFVRYSRPGLEMRAAVDNAGLAEVRGVSTARMARLAWVASYIFAAVSGVLLAPIFGSDPLLLTLVVLYALVAMVIGGMVSLPFTLVGGIIVGLTDALALGYLPAGDVTARVRGVLPFALLFTALVLRSRSFVSAGGVDEARSTLRSDGASFRARPEISRRSLAVVAAGGLVVVLLASDFWIYLLATGLGYGLIFLSYKFFTSTTGLVSLAQGAFGGIGAFSAAILATEHGIPWALALAGGGAAAALAGLVVALPTVRLRGIFLALATVAFAQLVETTAFNWEAFSGLEFGQALGRPWGFESDTRYFVLLLAVFLLVGWFADRFRRSVLGRELQADLASGMGSRSVGIRPERGRMVAFLISAGMAGLGGAMFTAVSGRTASQQWVMITALIWLTVAAIGGIRSMWGALVGGVLLASTPEVIRTFPSFGRVYIAAFGLVGLVFLRRPGGIAGLAEDVARAWQVYGRRRPADRIRLDRVRAGVAGLSGPVHLPPLRGAANGDAPVTARGPEGERRASPLRKSVLPDAGVIRARLRGSGTALSPLLSTEPAYAPGSKRKDVSRGG